MNIDTLIIEKYNEIFKEHNKSVEDYSTWYHNFYGSYGAQEIKKVDDSFHISIICHSKVKKIVIPFEQMVERIYLYDKYELEGSFMFSYNACKMHKDMKTSPSCDGYYLILNNSNRTELTKQINKELLSDYNHSLEFYNRITERNKTLPDIPKFNMDNPFEYIDHPERYKNNFTKPNLQKISLNSFFILETYT